MPARGQVHVGVDHHRRADATATVAAAAAEPRTDRSCRAASAALAPGRGHQPVHLERLELLERRPTSPARNSSLPARIRRRTVAAPSDSGVNSTACEANCAAAALAARACAAAAAASSASATAGSGPVRRPVRRSARAALDRPTRRPAGGGAARGAPAAATHRGGGDQRMRHRRFGPRLSTSTPARTASSTAAAGSSS